MSDQSMSDWQREARRASRRDALKKIGIGAGVAWTAPVAIGFFQPAAAGTPAPTTTSTTTSTTLPPAEECEGAVCDHFEPCSSSGPDCICITTVDGPFCVPAGIACSTLTRCSDENPCAPGFVCGIDTCCDEPVCVPLSAVAECPPDDDSTLGHHGSRSPRRATGLATLGG